MARKSFLIGRQRALCRDHDAARHRRSMSIATPRLALRLLAATAFAGFIAAALHQSRLV